jgi:hypothetical protein
MNQEQQEAPRKGVSKGMVIGGVVIVAALAMAIINFTHSGVNPVSFADAKKLDYDVWITGVPDAGSIYYDDVEKGSHVVMLDPTGARMVVIMRGPKPDGIEGPMAAATHISALGIWDGKSNEFFADKMLVKCPNEYKGQKPAERSYQAKPDEAN